MLDNWRLPHDLMLERKWFDPFFCLFWFFLFGFAFNTFLKSVVAWTIQRCAQGLLEMWLLRTKER